jgi:hypothetical protein
VFDRETDRQRVRERERERERERVSVVVVDGSSKMVLKNVLYKMKRQVSAPMPSFLPFPSKSSILQNV